MKFKKYDNVFPKIVTSVTVEGLEKLIEEFATKYKLVDIQFSTTKSNIVEYSALLLLQENTKQLLKE